MKWLKWSLVGLLMLACAVGLSACGGDDDDDGGGGTVVTNVVVVTNTPVVEPELVSVAPALITPEDGKVYSVLLLVGTGYKVNFEWTGVPNAVSYILELDGTQFVVDGTTASRELGFGEYEWRVWAKSSDGSSGPASAKSDFTIKSKIIVPSP